MSINTRVSLPSNASFTSFDNARAHIMGKPLSASTKLVVEQALLDVRFEYAIESERSNFAMNAALSHLGLQTILVLRYIGPDLIERLFRFDTDPGLVQLDPGWWGVTKRFVDSGFRHILGGADHLLFLLCLVIPLRRIRPLVAVVTAFTLAHSITLCAAALNLVPTFNWFPALMETLIALSIVFMALENIVGVTLANRWRFSLAFGLVHGFGFSYALAQNLQFAGSHLVTSLFAFNIGVELGQLVFLFVTIPILNLVLNYLGSTRLIIIIASAILAHTGWHWVAERFDLLAQYRFTWPEFTQVLLANSIRWLILALTIVIVFLLFRAIYNRYLTGFEE